MANDEPGPIGTWRSPLGWVIVVVAVGAAALAVGRVEPTVLSASVAIDTGARASAPADRAPVETTASSTAPTVLTFGLDDTPPDASWTRPPLLAPTTDAAYGTSLRRLTSAEGTRFDRNTYSRRQAENADGSAFMTYHGDAAYRVYDRDTGDLVRILDVHPDGEPQWHPTDPERIRHIAGSNSYVGDLTYRESSVRTGRQRVIADLTDRIQAVFPTSRYLADRAEGSPSADGDRHAWIVFDASERPIAVVSYALSTDTVLGLAPIESGGRIDWVSASPTGAFVVAGYVDKTVVYDADLTNRRLINEKADHSDIALTSSRTDAYVYIDFSAGVDGGWLVAVDLTTMARTRIFDLYDDANTSVHVSGKGFDKPGWVIVSTYNCKVPGAWSCDKVMAVEIGGGRRVLNLAHTYNCGDDYWTETHAVVNRAFTRVYFNSDAGSCGIDAEVYELTIPAFE